MYVHFILFILTILTFEILFTAHLLKSNRLIQDECVIIIKVMITIVIKNKKTI